MDKNSRILIVGHSCGIEKGLTRYFKENNYKNIFSSSSIGFDVSIQTLVNHFFQSERPEYIFLSSTLSGGIQANIDRPADFIYHNLASQNNIFYASKNFGVKKLLYYAGSCVYPKGDYQDIKEEALLTGSLEKTSEPYSVAKIAGIISARAFKKQFGLNAIVMVSATVYGKDCSLDSKVSHVVGALLGKFVDAVNKQEKRVEVWGTGQVRREFIYIDDVIEASLFLMKKKGVSQDIFNVGYGDDIKIRDLVEIIAEVVGFKGDIVFDSSKPDGVKRKLLDNSRINALGFKSKVGLKEGIEKTYSWVKDLESCDK